MLSGINGTSIMKKIQLFLLLILSLIGVNLTGCTWNHSNATLNIDIQTVSYLNPNANGRPSPLVLTFYQLKSPYQFKQLSYDQLTENAGKYLGNDLLDKQSLEARPNNKQTWHLSLGEETNYIGIVASFRNIDHAQWRQRIKLKKPGHTTSIWVDCQSQAIKADAYQSEFKL